MTESTLCLQPSGQWAIAAPGREPVNIVAGEVFLLEVLGERKLKQVRMMQRDGLRAGFFGQRERYARELE